MWRDVDLWPFPGEQAVSGDPAVLLAHKVPSLLLGTGRGDWFLCLEDDHWCSMTSCFWDFCFGWPGDLVLTETCLSGLSLSELAGPRRDHCCPPEILILLVRCIREMHKSLIRTNGFLPTCNFVGKVVFWVSTWQPSCPQSHLPDPFCSFTLFPEYKPSAEARLIALSL